MPVRSGPGFDHEALFQRYCSAHGVNASAKMYRSYMNMIAADCRRHGINPFDYLKDLLIRLPSAKITQIKEFTPAAWAHANGKDHALPTAA